MDYELIDASEDFYSVKINDEPYSGIVYQYGRVQVKEDEVSGDGILSFDYEIVEGDKSYEGNPQFENYVGDILVEIITKALESGEYKIGDKDDSTVDSNDNTEESA